MQILGIGDHVSCGSALIRDGEVIAAITDERLVREKMVFGIPRARHAGKKHLASGSYKDYSSKHRPFKGVQLIELIDPQYEFGSVLASQVTD